MKTEITLGRDTTCRDGRMKNNNEKRRKMNKHERERMIRIYDTLASYGFDRDEQDKLARIDGTLHAWYERECGDEHGNAIERDETTGKPFLTFDRPSGQRGRIPIADREKGALKRLAAIMERHPDYRAYVQGDPRGPAVRIFRLADIPTDRTMERARTEWMDCNSNRGLCVNWR